KKMTFEQDLYDLLTNHEKATVSDSFGGSKLGTNKAPNFSVSTMAKELLVIAHRGETGCERGFKHIARQARILADHDTMAVVTATKDTASRHADAQGGFRRHRAFVGFATNTVCAEIFAHHKVDYPVVGSPSKGTCLLNREYREISRMCS
ncbi:hypothetical protein, partial [Acinetobacter baumannii]|uniref:hypothetical protein n=1 Tax=Acinetobacter baumannii TaxID=470 RepID=UPI003F651AB0